MATFYVATTGNDSTGDGSIGAPWKTIQYGVDQLSPGDTLYIRGGTYVEEVKITSGGTSGSPIKIEGYAGETVTIDGEYTYPTGTLVREGDYSPYGYSYGFVYNGLVKITADYVEIRRINLKRSRGTGFFAEGADYVTIENCSAVDMRHRGSEAMSCNHFTLKDSVFLRLQNYAQFVRPSSVLNWGNGVSTKFSKNVVLDGLTVGEIWGEGVGPGQCSGVIVRNCEIYNAWRLGLYVNKTELGDYYNNVIYHAEPTDIPNSSGIVIRSEIGGGKGYQIRDIDIYNNLIVGCEDGLVMGRQSNSYANLGVRIFNNTFYGNKSKAFSFDSLSGSDTGIIRNNIFVGGKAAGSVPPDFSVDHNLWYLVSSPYSGAGNVNADPQLVNPDQTISARSISAANYKLQSSSPAINSGSSSSAPTTDYFGSTRGTNPDIGFHEYTGGGSAEYLTADFSVDSYSGPVPYSPNFTDQSLSSEGIATYAWSYSDDGGATWTSFGTNSSTATITFSTVGDRIIRLTVTDNSGNESVKERTVTAEDATTGTDTCTGNLITNPSFASGLTDWTFSSGGNTVSSSTSGGIGAFTVTDKGGTTQLLQTGISITAGQTYYLTFDGWVESGTITPRVTVRQHASPYKIYGLDVDPVFTTTKQTFSYEFIANTTDSNARFQIIMPDGGTYYLDNFCLSTTPYTPGGGGGTPPPSSNSVVVVTQVAANTASGNQTIDVTGITPTAAMFVVTRAYSGSNPDNDEVLSVGFADNSGNQVAFGHCLKSGVTANPVNRRTINDGCISVVGESYAKTNASIVSMAADEIVINWENAPAAGWMITVHAFEATNAYVGTVVTSSTLDGVVDNTSPGFQPDIVIGGTNNAGSSTFPASTASASKMNFSLGVADGIDQYVLARYIESSINAVQRLTNGRFLTTLANDGTLAGEIEIGDFDSSGFSLTTRALAFSGWNTTVMYLALQFSDNAVTLDAITTPTTTGNQSYTVGQQAGYAGLLISGAQALDTGYTDANAGVYGIGGWDGSTEASVGLAFEDGASPTNTESRYASTIIDMPNDDGTAGVVGDGVSASSTDLTINFTSVTSTGKKAILWTIKGSSDGQDDYYKTGMMPGIGIGMP